MVLRRKTKIVKTSNLLVRHTSHEVLIVRCQRLIRKGVLMTKNQIEYWKMQYDKEQRANELKETERSNKERERQNRLNYYEQVRLNTGNLSNAAESNRNTRLRDLETQRSNLAREGETRRANDMNFLNQALQRAEQRRSNLASERIASLNSLSQARNASTESSRLAVLSRQINNNYKVAQAQVAETRRNNNLNYGINSYKNTLTALGLKIQATKADRDYDIAQQNLGLQQQNLLEQQRHNEIQEYIGGLQTAGRYASLLTGGKF